MPHDSHFRKRNLILNIISHLGPISRTELINLTDFRPASVSAIIKELLDEQMIVETGYTSTGYGRKRVLLEINKSHLCAIGLSFSPGSVTFLVAQIDGTTLHRENVPVSLGMPKEALIEQIVERTGELLQMFRDKNIVGIGIGEPLYDPTSYQPEYSLLNNYLHINDWVKLQLKPRLEALSNLRVETYNGVVLASMVSAIMAWPKAWTISFVWSCPTVSVPPCASTAFRSPVQPVGPARSDTQSLITAEPPKICAIAANPVVLRL